MTNIEFNHDQFIQTIQALGMTSKEPLGEHSIKNSQRFEMYQRSFIGRTVCGLQKNLFEQVAAVFGQDVVHEVLSRYFLSRQTSELMITESIGDLSTFIRNAGNEPYHQLFAGLVDISLTAWTLLHDVDPPATEPTHGHDLRLMPTSRLCRPLAGIDLFNAWTAPSSAGHDMDQFFSSSPSGVLLCKTSAVDAYSIKVTPDLVPLVEILFKGTTIIEAISHMDEVSAGMIDAGHLKELIDELVIHRCLY